MACYRDSFTFTRFIHEVLMGNLERKGLLGRSKSRWEEKDEEYGLDSSGYHLLALVDTIITFLVLQNVGNFLSICVTGSSSRRTGLQGVSFLSQCFIIYTTCMRKQNDKMEMLRLLCQIHRQIVSLFACCDPKVSWNW
jgi:hypothetical protein